MYVQFKRIVEDEVEWTKLADIRKTEPLCLPEGDEYLSALESI